MNNSVLFIISFLLASCTPINSPQQELLNKKWYFGKNNDYIIFRSDMKTKSMYKGETLIRSFEFEGENNIIFNRQPNDTFPETRCRFEIKDSLLLMFINITEEEFDTSFLHLNSNYKHWQIREIYYYGKVIHEKNPVPFIYFEF